MKTVKFFTLGCKVNQYETQSIRERFQRLGYREIHNGKAADIYLINTCTVTAVADRKSRNTICRSIKENPQAKIIVTGCLVEEDTASVAKIKGIDFIIKKRFFKEEISDFSGHTRAFLKIQDGCNNLCSYCKVPLVRGRSRSRTLQEIIQEATALVKNNFKEIVLSGICLGAYGRDLKGGVNLADVIRRLEAIEGLLRIRLSSIEAGDVSGELIKKIAESGKLCPHLHIPIQSGDDEVLKKMNRGYTRDGYLNLINRIKKYVPDVAITTDVLVGFPGEDDKNFQNTLNLIKEISPLRTHIFPYSKREGTVAAKIFKQRPDHKIIKERIGYLKKIAQECSLEFKKQFLYNNVNVLIETQSQGYWQGYTDNYIMVLVKSTSNLKNQLIKVRLKEMNKDFMLADLYQGDI